VQPEFMARVSMEYPMPSWAQQECQMQYGYDDCRCLPDGCPACTREDYTYTIGECDTNAMQTVRFYLPPFVCNPDKGVDLPSSYTITCVYLPDESVQAQLIITLTTLGIVFAIACSIFVFLHRQDKYVLAAQPLFLQFFLIGAIITLAGNTMPIGRANDD